MLKNFKEEVTLIKKTYKLDKIGNSIPTKEERTILCNEKSVYGNDFYIAGQVGLKPDVVLEIHNMEYDGEQDLRYKNKNYKVIRSYRNGDYLELTAGEYINERTTNRN